ncbi:MAG: FAD:protein FMN transferase [Thermodesulfovibrionales bacterium]|nr:FAD:protein FMN transferase [Thermodesulfovibrionales bacterium]
MNNKKQVNLLIPFAALSLCVLLTGSCAKKEKLYRKSALLMNTTVTITVVSDSSEKADAAVDAAIEDIKRLEALISFWSTESEISAINRNAGVKEVAASPDTIDMIEKALFVSEKTGGAFDATIGPIIRLYDFKKKIKPDDRAIRKKLPLVNYKEMAINRDASTAYLRKKDMSFDTGGIAKGYAAHRAAEALKATGINAGIVAVAGDIRAFGLKPDGKPWLVGIRNPETGDKEDLLAVLGLSDESISTSGDYERYFIEKDGTMYHHILDPKTGKPARGVRSVTVISKEGAFSDGFSTGIFVMGTEKGMKLLNEMGFEGLIVDNQGKIYMTDGLKERIKFKGKNED